MQTWLSVGLLQSEQHRRRVPMLLSASAAVTATAAADDDFHDAASFTATRHHQRCSLSAKTPSLRGFSSKYCLDARQNV